MELLHKNFDADPRITIVDFDAHTIKVDCDGCEENMIVEAHRGGGEWVQTGVMDPIGSVRVWRLKIG